MHINNSSVPLFAARLVTGFLQNKLSESEKDQLDSWVTESDENQELFEKLIDGYEESVFDPSQVIIETEEATEIWIIAGIITMFLFDEINEIEKKHLMEWANFSERNQQLFQKMQQVDFLSELLLWLRPWLRGKYHLN